MKVISIIKILKWGWIRLFLSKICDINENNMKKIVDGITIALRGKKKFNLFESITLPWDINIY